MGVLNFPALLASGVFIKTRVFRLCLVFLLVLVCGESKPETLPSLFVVIEAESRSPSEFGVKVSLVYLFLLGLFSFSFRILRWCGDVHCEGMESNLSSLRIREHEHTR